MTRFTFKKEPRETGLSGVACPYPNTRIKLGGKLVGTIYAPDWTTKDNKWSVQFMIQYEAGSTAPCEFRWATLKKRFDSEPEAREYVQANTAALLLWKLHAREEEDQ